MNRDKRSKFNKKYFDAGIQCSHSYPLFWDTFLINKIKKREDKLQWFVVTELFSGLSILKSLEKTSVKSI